MLVALGIPEVMSQRFKQGAPAFVSLRVAMWLYDRVGSLSRLLLNIECLTEGKLRSLHLLHIKTAREYIRLVRDRFRGRLLTRSIVTCELSEVITRKHTLLVRGRGHSVPPQAVLTLIFLIDEWLLIIVDI